MKKIIMLVLALSMFVCVFASCSKNTEPESDTIVKGYNVVPTEEDITTTDRYVKFIDGYLEKCQSFYDNTNKFLDSNKDLHQGKIIEKWNNGDGSWWRTIYSSTMSFKDIYSQPEPPNSADRIYRDKIFAEGDSLINTAVQLVKMRLGFDPTDGLDDPGYEPWNYEFDL